MSDSPSTAFNPEEELNALKKVLERERSARKEAERILEEKSLALYQANQELLSLNRNLEEKVARRTRELEEIARFPMQNPDPLLRMDLNGNILFQNPVARNIHSIVKFGKAHPAHEFWGMIAERVKKEQSIVRIEAEANGLQYAFHCKFIPEEQYINVYGRDITERKVAERRLRETASRLSALITNLQAGILVEDESRHIALTNQRFCDLFGITALPEQLFGADCSNSAEQSKVLFRDPAQFVKRIDEILLKKEPAIAEELILADGRTFERDYIPIYSEEKNYLGHLWQYRDITERKLFEQQIRDSEEKYRRIIENMNLGMVEVDNQETVRYANQSFCRMTGYQLEEMVGRNIGHLLLGESANPQHQEVIEKRKAGISDAYEIRIRNKEGHDNWMLISGAPMYDSQGQVIGSIGIHLDISDRKQLERELTEAKDKAEMSSQAKELFLANMSHEIRTPMNAILGMGRLLTRTDLSQKQSTYLDAMISSAEYLLVVINDILDFSRIESGKISLETIGFRPSALLSHVNYVSSIKAEEKGLSLEVSIDPKIPAVVLGDPYRLNQVLINLVGNAVKFTERGTVKVDIQVLELKSDTTRLRFRVEDTGVGIAQDRQEAVFQSFEQENAAVARIHGGAGLGLAISRHLVKLMGGELNLSSKIGIGTNVWFDLPFPVGSAEDAPEREERHDEATVALPDCNILIAEDNPMNQVLVETILENAGARFVTVATGTSAIEKMKEGSFDLVLMDMRMPDMDGLRATELIRDELQSSVPIIALTANAIAGDKERCLAAGMNDYISKPFTEGELTAKIRQWVSGNQCRQVTEQIDAHAHSYSIKRLETIGRGNREFVARMLRLFCEFGSTTVNEIEAAAKSGDIHTVSELAHRLKPSIDNLDLSAFKDVIRELEALNPENFDAESVEVSAGILSKGIREIIRRIRSDYPDMAVSASS